MCDVQPLGPLDQNPNPWQDRCLCPSGQNGSRFFPKWRPPKTGGRLGSFLGRSPVFYGIGCGIEGGSLFGMEMVFAAVGMDFPKFFQKFTISMGRAKPKKVVW